MKVKDLKEVCEVFFIGDDFVSKSNEFATTKYDDCEIEKIYLERFLNDADIVVTVKE